MADKQQLSRAIAFGSIGFGIAGVLSPAGLGRSYGLDDTPQMRLMGRLFSSRNLALGALALAAEDDAAGDRVLMAAAGINVLDTLAALAGGSRGLPKRAAAMVALTTVGFAAASVAALTRD
jgi:hypothetical protein